MTWQEIALIVLLLDLAYRVVWGTVRGVQAVLAAPDEAHGPDRRHPQRR